jgi:thiamine-monophosphate kinase
MTMAQIGRRAYHAAASDLAAMGAAPRAALLSLVLPDTVDDEALLSLVGGIADAADDVAAPVIGGNLAHGCELSITTTVVGEVGDQRLERRGAKPGQGVYVTGALGASALGVLALEAGRGDDPRFQAFVEAYRRPVAQVVIGQRLVSFASAAADVSDGLVADLRHVCEASGVGARIRADLVPTLPGFDDAVDALGANATRLALAGGEDYQLVFTAPVSTSAAELATLVGHVTEDRGVVCLGSDDGPLEGDFSGFDHF